MTATPASSNMGLPAGLTVVDREQQRRPPARRWRRCVEVVDEILKYASEPWVSLGLAGDELVSVRPGGIVLLIGPTGRGKTSLASCLLLEHAKHAGPALSCSLELPADEWTARAIGSRRDASWPQVLRGEVSREDMVSALPERLAIIDRHNGSFEALEEAITELRAEYPDEPILVAVDYVQLVGADSDLEIRTRIGKVMRRLDRLAREQRVVLIALSQGSRQSARALSSGERIGAETTDAGAESADLERWASVTLAIGALGSEAEDGTSAVELSLGKGRMTGGDRVVPARFCGRTGLWRIAGEARAAAEVRAERKTQREQRDVKTKALAVAQLLSMASAPMSRRDIRAEVGGDDGTVRAAVHVLLADPESGVVEVEPRKNGSYRVWTRDRALAAGCLVRERQMTGEVLQ